MWTNARVHRLEPSEDGVTVTVQQDGATHLLHVSVVVLACGPRYQFQQQLGMGSPRRWLKTVQAEVDVPRGGLAKIFLGSRVAPGSFAWWLPVRAEHGTRAKIGVTAISTSQQAFEAFLQVLTQEGLLQDAEILARAWMIPITPLARTYATRVVAVGDAAGQTKPTTGGGLYYGLLCATLAAETLIQGFQEGDLSAGYLARYQARWRQLLGRELRTAARFRWLFEHLSDRELEQIVEVLRQDGLLQFLEEQADFDWHRRTILRAIAYVPFGDYLWRTLRQAQLVKSQS